MGKNEDIHLGEICYHFEINKIPSTLKNSNSFKQIVQCCKISQINSINPISKPGWSIPFFERGKGESKYRQTEEVWKENYSISGGGWSLWGRGGKGEGVEHHFCCLLGSPYLELSLSTTIPKLHNISHIVSSLHGWMPHYSIGSMCYRHNIYFWYTYYSKLL